LEWSVVVVNATVDGQEQAPAPAVALALAEVDEVAAAPE
jgi:hypothetical protein